MDDDDEFESIKNPKFKNGQTVKITESLRPILFSQTDLKGFTGRILESYMEDGEENYVMELDHTSLGKLPIEYLTASAEAGATFDEVTCSPEYLKKTKLKFDLEKTEELRYKLDLQSNFVDEEPEIQKIITDALLQDVGEEENENWLNYFEGCLLYTSPSPRDS